MGSDGHEEGMEGVDLGGRLRTRSGDGKEWSIKKPNCYIVQRSSYILYDLMFVLVILGRKWKDGRDGHQGE